MSDIDLTLDERKILEILGKLHISQSKNINETTIRKKLPAKYHKNLHETIKSLHSKGLLRYYRSQNYCLTEKVKRSLNDWQPNFLRRHMAISGFC